MIGNFLYNLIVGPIEILLEICFSISCRIFGNYGIAIIGLSILIQTLVLPLYKKADAIQDTERKKQKDMQGMVNHIKKTFKGDKRYMVLNTYYRQQNYNPMESLKVIFPLLLQIPFFIAGFNFLSNLPILSNQSFLFIKDLGSPDNILKINGMYINILPFAMTFFNLLSSYIYTKDLMLKDKIQTYALAFVFLILLYNSPSGLLLYWTCNNLYSLLKNVFLKLFKFKQKKKLLKLNINIDRKKTTLDFLIYSLILAIFIGYMIPSYIISVSPADFGFINNEFILNILAVFFKCLGLFTFYGYLIFYMSSDMGKYFLSKIYLFFTIMSFLNYFILTSLYGEINSNFQYNNENSNNLGFTIFITFVTLIIFLIVLFFPTIKNKEIILIKNVFKFSVLVTLFLAGTININDTISSEEFVSFDNNLKNNLIPDEGEKILRLSKNGKNVIFIVLDNFGNTALQYILEENPSYLEAFSGFISYENTLSLARSTNYAISSVYGGYEYTPKNINLRKDESLELKHNEALQVLPTIFNSEGFVVSTIDAACAGYTSISDMSIFEEEINSYYLGSIYAKKDYAKDLELLENSNENNLIYYAFSRVFSPIFFDFIYNDGQYFSPFINLCTLNFFKGSANLAHVNQTIEILNDDSNNFNEIYNIASHERILLDDFNEVIKYVDFNINNSIEINNVLMRDENVLKMDIYGVEYYNAAKKTLEYIYNLILDIVQ